MKDFIGLQFKRNVYGLSNWTKTVEDYFIVWHLKIVNNSKVLTPEIVLIAKESGATYSLNEVVFVNNNNPIFF